MTIQASWRVRELDRTAVHTGLDRLAGLRAMEIRLRFNELRRRHRPALFVTREPLCAATLLEAQATDRLKAEPRLLVSNRRDRQGLARCFRLPFAAIPWEDRTRAEADALALLDQREIDLLVLARFMKILSPNFVWRFKN